MVLSPSNLIYNFTGGMDSSTQTYAETGAPTAVDVASSMFVG